MESLRLTKSDIEGLFELLNADLVTVDAYAEVLLVGGAVMGLALATRDATDLRGVFLPTEIIREAATRVAARAGLPEEWLNSAVKHYLGPFGDPTQHIDLDHLQVFVAPPAYLLAMKCAAMWLGEEFRDRDDVRYLLRYHNVVTADEAMELVEMYFPEGRLMPDTRVALERLLARGPDWRDRRGSPAV